MLHQSQERLLRHPKVLKELESVWYEKLRESGFEDIEDTSHPDRPLISWHSFRFGYMTEVKRRLAVDYYEQGKQLLYSYEFKNEKEKAIWALHIEGYSSRQIVNILGNKRRCKRWVVTEITKRLRQGIKCRKS